MTDDSAPSDRSAPAPADKESPLDGHRIDEVTQRDVWAITELARAAGLRFWDVTFETIPRKHMVQLGTYVLPYRWSHWTFGREYARMTKLHDLGMVEILELVINTRPAHAYLIDANTRDDNRMVIAHVLAHVDFFANNMWFERTPDDVLTEAHHHERRLRELADEHGRDAVERALDSALSIQWNIDFYRHYHQAAPRPDTGPLPSEDPKETSGDADAAGVTPNDRLHIPRRQGPPPTAPPALKPDGHRDLVEFLIAHGRLDELEREVLSIVREETLYFWPNATTKIMNEGWATYWHAELMRELLPFEAFDRFAVKHSHLMQGEGLNPYKLGLLIWEDIRRRGDAELGPGKGLERMYEVRRYGDDASFLREHLTQEVVDKAGLYLFDEDPQTGERVVTSTRVEDVKPAVLMQIENLGKPLILVDDGDLPDGGLLLRHADDDREIDMDYAADVIAEVQRFWKGPVHLEAQVNGKRCVLTHDGTEAQLRQQELHGDDDDADDEGPAESEDDTVRGPDDGGSASASPHVKKDADSGSDKPPTVRAIDDRDLSGTPALGPGPGRPDDATRRATPDATDATEAPAPAADEGQTRLDDRSGDDPPATADATEEAAQAAAEIADDDLDALAAIDPERAAIVRALLDADEKA